MKRLPGESRIEAKAASEAMPKLDDGETYMEAELEDPCPCLRNVHSAKATELCLRTSEQRDGPSRVSSDGGFCP